MCDAPPIRTVHVHTTTPHPRQSIRRTAHSGRSAPAGSAVCVIVYVQIDKCAACRGHTRAERAQSNAGELYVCAVAVVVDAAFLMVTSNMSPCTMTMSEEDHE